MSPTLRSGWPGALVLLTLAVGPGCRPAGPPPPKTYAVKGRVMYKDGQPATGAAVEFRPSDPSSPASSGEVGEDGTFTLSCFFNNRKLPGAVAGTFEVTVMPPQGSDQSAHAVTLPKPYTVNPDDNNDFTITIDRPRRRT